MPVCSQCQSTIPAEDVNVASDVAFCRPCNRATRLSDLVSSSEPLVEGSLVEFDPTNPPHGTWARGGPDDKMELVASHHEIVVLAFVVPCVFWDIFISAFLIPLISVPLNPATLIIWLCFIPFILYALSWHYRLLNCLFGRTTLRIGHSGGELFTGIGPFGWTQRFNALEVSDVRCEYRRWRDSDGNAQRSTHGMLVFKDGKEMMFGSNCPTERLQFLVAGAKTTIRSLVGEELLDTHDNASSDNEHGVNVELGMAVAVAVPVKEQTNPVLGHRKLNLY